MFGADAFHFALAVLTVIISACYLGSTICAKVWFRHKLRFMKDLRALSTLDGEEL